MRVGGASGDIVGERGQALFAGVGVQLDEQLGSGQRGDLLAGALQLRVLQTSGRL